MATLLSWWYSRTNTSVESVTGRYYWDVILKMLKQYYLKRRPVSGFWYVRLFHDNSTSHIYEVVKKFLKLEKFTILPQQPYSPDRMRLFVTSKTSKKFLILQSLQFPSIHWNIHHLNQCTQTHFRNAFRDWNYVFQILWRNELVILLFESNALEILYKTRYISDNHHIWPCFNSQEGHRLSTYTKTIRGLRRIYRTAIVYRLHFLFSVTRMTYIFLNCLM